MQCLVICERENTILNKTVKKLASEGIVVACDPVEYPNKADFSEVKFVKDVKERLKLKSFAVELPEFFVRFKEAISGAPLPAQHMIVVEYHPDSRVHLTSERIGVHLREGVANAPIFFVLSVSESQLKDVDDALLRKWDAVLLCESTNWAVWRSAIYAYRSGYQSFLNSWRKKFFWRLVDLAFVCVAPFIVGLCGGFGEGLGQSFYNANWNSANAGAKPAADLDPEQNWNERKQPLGQPKR